MNLAELLRLDALLPELEDSSFLAGVVLAGAGLAATGLAGAALAVVIFAAGFFTSSSSSELDESDSESESLAGVALTGAGLTEAALAGVTLAAGFFTSSSSELDSGYIWVWKKKSHIANGSRRVEKWLAFYAF